ncbi:hypothetical protein FACS18945_3080 [Bacteroidia bacterium]|nr:hypothetical protein FACS18945_3080 [Bacteroidia bacterium]
MYANVNNGNNFGINGNGNSGNIIKNNQRELIVIEKQSTNKNPDNKHWAIVGVIVGIIGVIVAIIVGREQISKFLGLCF